MKNIFLLFIFFYGTITTKAQTVTFDSSIPSNWSTSGTNTISLSNTHYKDGTKSLKWVAANNQVLTASSLGITSTQTGSSANSTTHFYIYSEEESLDTLVVDFVDDMNVVKRTGRVLLNFKGWRDYHRNFVTDYGQGNNLSGFTLSKVKFTFKKSGAGNKNIWIDNLDWVSDTDRRFPGLHMLLDKSQFQVTSSLAGGWPLDSWMNTPDIAPTTPSSAELTGINTIRGKFSVTSPTVTSAELTEATDYFNYCNISETNNVVIGRGLLNITNQDTLVKYANYCSTFARSYLQNNNTSSQTKLILFTKYIIDQGLAEGGRNVITTNTYTNARSFTNKFLEAMPAYTGTLREDVIKMLKWSNEYNRIYINQFLVRHNMDFVHIKLEHIINLALLSSDNAEVARDLKSIGRFMRLVMEPGDGGRDGIKPDGLGFHHQSKYLHYMYAYATWIDHAYNLRGTPFKISLEAYNYMLKAVKVMYLELNKGIVRANSTSGRFPFSQSVLVSSTAFKNLVTIGADIINQSVEPEAASLYNYFFKTTFYSGVPVVNLDGFHQFNYGQMGVKRSKNWIAIAKGLTNKMFGAEIYADANRYGRYQGYGALDILYETSASTGYISGGNGWDWNMMPGTTSVHVSYNNLRPASNSTKDEYQGGSFAGALSAGNDGVFAMDFVQDPQGRYTTNNLTFRKSIFSFDSILVCLGSKINGDGGTVATNLFQSINSSTNPAIYINSLTATTADISTNLSTTGSNWIVNGQTTGFFIPAGNNQIQIVRGNQTTPINTSNIPTNTASANASKAWINHGSTASNASYQYVVVPDTTPDKMQVLADSINQGKVYEVLANNINYHAVKYKPTNTTGYSFFTAAPSINIGYLQNVSNKCLITTKEVGDTLIVRIANPDLNTVADSDPTVDWVSSPSNVSITLTNRWRLLSSSSSGTTNTVNHTNSVNSIKLDFVLNQGNFTEVKLVKDQTEMGYGVWNFNEKIWGYNLSTATSSSATSFTSSSSASSVSDSISYGFLPYPPFPSKARVGLGSSGNGSFNRIGLGDNQKIRVFANSSSLNKLSVYEVGNNPVVSAFYTLTFGADGTNGNWILGLGNNAITNVFTSSSNLSSTTYTNGIFSALRFDLSSNNISFKYRKVVNSIPSFTEIDNTTFIKDNEYFLEFYANNSSNASSYTKANINYTVNAQSYQLWVNGVRIFVPGVGYNIPATELTANENINGFFITSSGNTLPTNSSASLTIADMQMRYEDPITTTTWYSTGWSNGAPTASIEAIIEADYNTTTNGAISAKKLTVNTGVLTVDSGNLTVVNELINNAGATAVVFENDANLIQGTATTVNANTGAITVKRNSSTLRLLDYTLWSSPVVNQNLLAFSPETVITRFYNYNTATNLYNAVLDPANTTFSAGNGYLIRMPNTWSPTIASAYPGVFTGTPTNGTVSVGLTDYGAGFRYNLVGNPYPSPINMQQFVDDNSANITASLYFWRKTNAAPGAAYCTWNNGTFVTNNQAQVFTPNGIIQTGQGFIVEAKSGATGLTFNNGQRVADNAGQFFKTEKVVENNRIWLNVLNTNGEFAQMAINYATGATQGVDDFDAKYFNDGTIALNSLLDNADYAIQGRALPFNGTDEVPLSFKAATAGTYSIVIDHVDGLFAANQDVILKDNVTGAETNLKAGAYAFAAEAGASNSRFVLKYQKTLGAIKPVFTEDSVIINTKKGLIHINSGSITMKNVKLFDMNGRLVFKKENVNNSETTIDGSRFAKQVLIVKITSDDKKEVSKKVVN